MELFIDTSDAEMIKVSLFKEGEVVRNLTDKNRFGSQALLPLIKKLLSQERVELKDLQEITVSTGPGSFTGLKVGVAVANSLAFSLGVRVNGKELETEINYQA